MKSIILLFSFVILIACKKNVEKPNITELNTKSDQIHCINEIFKRDSIFGDIRNHASENSSVSEAINKYAKNLKSLDFSGCPEDFKLAFHKHIEAWLDFKTVSDKHPSLRGELHDVFTIIEKSKDSIAFKDGLDQILKTWKLVEEKSERQ